MNNTYDTENCDIEKESRSLPITVMSGFLGSGKTTVLNHLIRQPELNRTLVIINEFGEIGLDHDLMVYSTNEAVIEMSNGCFCCTLRRDLARTLREALGRFARGGQLWFDRVVIETTGIADPAPILNTLMTDPKIANQYELDGVIVTVDAVNGNDTLDRQVESVKQAAVADRLLITKTDLVDNHSLHKLQHRLRVLNPAAAQIIITDGTIDPGAIFDVGLYNPKTKSLNVQNWLKAEAYAEAQSDEQSVTNGEKIRRHDAKIQTVCITIDKPIRRESLDLWFETLRQFKGADFLRMKGITNVLGSDGPIVIHGVQHVFHPITTLKQWPSEDRQSRIVFITRDIDASALRDTLYSR